MKEDVFKISLENLKKGASLCFRKSYAFTSNAKFLFENHKDSDIVSSLLVSAIEELGKGLILKESHIAQNTSFPKWVFGKGLQTHTKKIQKGMEELGEKSLLHPKLFEILSHKDTKFNEDGSMQYPSELVCSEEELSEMTQTGFGHDYDSMVDYKTKLDQSKKFQLFYVDWNSDEKKWQYGMWYNDYQMKNLLKKLEIYLKKYHGKDNDYGFEYS